MDDDLGDRASRGGWPAREHIAWNAAAGDDELDIVVEILGSKYFLELKDREFGIGDAYPFASRTSRYGADGGAALSTERIHEEVKAFFRERAGIEPLPNEAIEGEQKI